MRKKEADAVGHSGVWKWVLVSVGAAAFLLAVFIASGGVYRTVNIGGGDFYIVNRFNGRTWLVRDQEVTRIWTPAQKRAREEARAERRLANIERIETAARRVRAVAVGDPVHLLYHWPYVWHPHHISRDTPLPRWIDPMGLGTQGDHAQGESRWLTDLLVPPHRHERPTRRVGNPHYINTMPKLCFICMEWNGRMSRWPGHGDAKPPDKCLASLRDPLYFRSYLEALEAGYRACLSCLPAGFHELLTDTPVLAEPRPRAGVLVRLLAGDEVGIVADHASFWGVDTETHGIGWVPKSALSLAQERKECEQWLRGVLEAKRMASDPHAEPYTRWLARRWLFKGIDGWATDRDAALALRRRGLGAGDIGKRKGWSLRYVEGLLWGEGGEK